MLAKKYKTAKEKKQARSKVNAQNYARNRAQITKHRRKKYANAVEEQHKQQTARLASSKPNTVSKEQKENRIAKANGRKIERSQKIPKQNIPPTRYLDSSSEIDKIEYLTNYDLPPRPKVFLEYKEVVGPNWVAEFFNQLHATYAKHRDADIMVQAHNHMQDILHRMEHLLAVLELEAIDKDDLIRVETGKEHLLSNFGVVIHRLGCRAEDSIYCLLFDSELALAISYQSPAPDGSRRIYSTLVNSN
ncbi:hypothetical protein BT96DRAFT_948462 [Gymnopus androsaceus JB14]|uniref:Uncharacterized protein n=1 Tax=Gymnopus androsaceus JB14 TaxID=1447944 RepID=A0A6A4GPZ9_9AGAR|nr:hypothetical protein BT96DRAFT_948462 [Gymnopus androsaceus JB14]